MSANSKYKTFRGREFNMGAFVEKNGDTKAVGNTAMNARGDIIDQRTGNVKLPASKISQAAANLQNNQSKKVSLKADETITPIKRDAPAADTNIKAATPAPVVVSTRKIDTPNGTATEYEYDDGSMQVVMDPVDPTNLESI